MPAASPSRSAQAGKERGKDHRRKRIERDRNGESVDDRKAHFVAFASGRSKSTRRRSTAGARFGNLPPIGKLGGNRRLGGVFHRNGAPVEIRPPVLATLWTPGERSISLTDRAAGL